MFCRCAFKECRQLWMCYLIMIPDTSYMAIMKAYWYFWPWIREEQLWKILDYFCISLFSLASLKMNLLIWMSFKLILAAYWKAYLRTKVKTPQMMFNSLTCSFLATKEFYHILHVHDKYRLTEWYRKIFKWVFQMYLISWPW